MHPCLPAAAAGLAFAALLHTAQDPPPVPPAAAAPAQQPHAPRGPARHPLEGVYALRARFVDGEKVRAPSQGWLALTRRHLFLCVSAPGADAEVPLLRAAVRTWEGDGAQASTTVRMGWFTDRDGTVHVEQPGTVERRRIEAIRGGVRIAQDDRNFLEFERVE